MINNTYCFIRYIYQLPHTIHGFTVSDHDGNANIYINANIPTHRKHAAVQHELRHISRGDFYNDIPIHDIEQ